MENLDTCSGTFSYYLCVKEGKDMTLTLRPDGGGTASAFIEDSGQIGLQPMGLPVIRLSLLPGDKFEVPEGYSGAVSSLRPVYIEGKDESGFPRICPVEALLSGRYRLEGNLIRSL